MSTKIAMYNVIMLWIMKDMLYSKKELSYFYIS